jgi:hypothetical protein
MEGVKLRGIGSGFLMSLTGLIDPLGQQVVVNDSLAGVNESGHTEPHNLATGVKAEGPIVQDYDLRRTCSAGQSAQGPE